MSSSSHNTLTIGIIGFGPFAQFLSRTIIKKGHSIRATSRSDNTELCTQLGVSYYRDMTAFLESDNDVILLCTSIMSLSEVIRSIPFNCLKKPVLFVDVLSVKEYPKDLLLQVLPNDSDILCTHPMFGPESGKDGWKDLSLMYDRVRIKNEGICTSFLQIFQSEVRLQCDKEVVWARRDKELEAPYSQPNNIFGKSRSERAASCSNLKQANDKIKGCKMLEMTCEEHDKMAARSQFLTHMIGRMLTEMEIGPTAIDTKGFQKLVQVKESTARDSFDLFCGLFIHNRFAKQQLRNTEIAFETIKQQLLKRMNELD